MLSVAEHILHMYALLHVAAHCFAVTVKECDARRCDINQPTFMYLHCTASYLCGMHNVALKCS